MVATTDPRLNLWTQRKTEIERLTRYQHERRRTCGTSGDPAAGRILDRLITATEAAIVTLEDQICERP